MMRKSYKAIALLACMFVLGGIAGAAGMRAVDNREMGALLDASPAEANLRLKLRALARQLGLSDEQKSRIAQILQEQREECGAMGRQIEEQRAQCRQKARAAVEDVLSAEQRDRLDRILRRQERRAAGRGPQ